MSSIFKALQEWYYDNKFNEFLRYHEENDKKNGCPYAIRSSDNIVPDGMGFRRRLALKEHYEQGLHEIDFISKYNACRRITDVIDGIKSPDDLCGMAAAPYRRPVPCILDADGKDEHQRMKALNATITTFGEITPERATVLRTEFDACKVNQGYCREDRATWGDFICVRIAVKRVALSEHKKSIVDG